MPLSAIQPYPPHVYEHNDESRTLFHRRVRKAVVAAFEDIAKERGTELTRNEYDDFLVVLNLIMIMKTNKGVFIVQKIHKDMCWHCDFRLIWKIAWEKMVCPIFLVN